jgi:hypothetical protein
MRAIVDGQVPSVGDENAGQNGASCRQVNDRESEPHLPKDLVNRDLRSCVMYSVLYRGKGMQHKAVNDVLGQSPG